MKIAKPWVSWEEFEEIVGGNWAPGSHSHVHTEITDWGTYIDQALLQASSPTFAGVTINGNIIVTGTVDGVDVAALKTDVDEFPDDLKNLQATEIAELENIGATTISAAQWGYLGAMGDWLDQAVKQASSPTFAGVTLGNEGLHLLDTGGDHDLIIKPGTDLGADRILTITTGDAARTITLSGNPTLGDWFDQSVKQASSPTFTGNWTFTDQRYPVLFRNDGDLTVRWESYSNAQQDNPTIKQYRGRGTEAIPVIVQENDPTGEWTSYGYDGVQFRRTARIYMDVDGVPGEDDMPGRIDFEVTPSGGITPVVRMSLGHTGLLTLNSVSSGEEILRLDGKGNENRDFMWKISGPAADYDTLILRAEQTSAGEDFSDILGIKYNGWVGINKIDPTCELDVNGTIKATTFEGNLHWDYITNEPTYYPPEYHYHVGKDVVSLHLVDLDDVEADDIFDVLATAAVHGQGNYDWWGTWTTTADANCSAEIVVLAGDDKMLRLTDNNAAGEVYTQLIATSDHVMVTGVMEFKMRSSAVDQAGGVQFRKGAVVCLMIFFENDGHIYLNTIGEGAFDCGAYLVDTWYTIRLHYDCVARQAVLFLDNVFTAHRALSAAAAGDYVDRLHFYTNNPSTGFTVDFNNLKVFNLTI